MSDPLRHPFVTVRVRPEQLELGSGSPGLSDPRREDFADFGPAGDEALPAFDAVLQAGEHAARSNPRFANPHGSTGAVG